VAPPITQISFVVSLVINSLPASPAVPKATLTGLKQRLGHAAVFAFHCWGQHRIPNIQSAQAAERGEEAICELKNAGVRTMMFVAAAVLVLASTGIPVLGLKATLDNLKPSAGDLFQDPWKGT
jgi:hypothetical protein